MKIAISLPEKDFTLLEKLRAKLKKNRSELIQEALEYWLSSQEQKDLVDKYVAGYKRKPEKLSHIKLIEKAQYTSLAKEAW